MIIIKECFGIWARGETSRLILAAKIKENQSRTHKHMLFNQVHQLPVLISDIWSRQYDAIGPER